MAKSVLDRKDSKHQSSDSKVKLLEYFTARLSETSQCNLPELLVHEEQKIKKLRIELEASLVNLGRPLKTEKEDIMDETNVNKFNQNAQKLLRENKLLIISGPPQSGKSTLAELLAVSDRRQHIRIYVTDQLDTKSLLGNYICGETVGEFEWREGPLSSIVKNGGILILENFQEAKDELVELIADIINDKFRIRGENIQVKDSFRAICTFSVQNQEHVEKLLDLKKLTNQAAEIIKLPISISDLMKSYPDLSTNSLISGILSELFKIVHDYNKDLKSELKSTIIEATFFLKRINHLFTKSFKGENPIHFSINFKLSLVHISYSF